MAIARFPDLLYIHFTLQRGNKMSGVEMVSSSVSGTVSFPPVLEPVVIMIQDNKIIGQTSGFSGVVEAASYAARETLNNTNGVTYAVHFTFA